jgi:predicted ATPase
VDAREMDLQTFRAAVDSYRRPTGHTQRELASALGLHPNVLSHKLHGNDGASLRHDEVRGIVRVLAAWQALTTRAQAIDLLALMDLGPNSISTADWVASPLAQLDPGSDVPPVWRAAARPLLRPAAWGWLPAELTPLVGRGHHLEQVVELLQGAARLVTLTGAGGSGKTRLALAASAVLAQRGAMPACLVSLATVRDPMLVPSAVAAALGLREPANGGQRIEVVLLDYLRDQQLLLLLDNLEQVLGAAPLIAELLRNAPGLRVLATSRVPLRVYGEHEFRVPPLRLPPPGASPPEILASEAVDLFVQRARAARADFRPAPDQVVLLARICANLDGLPLAIELAAARVRHLPLPVLLDRLANRLELLDHGPGDMPARQRTLRAALDWSYELLPAARQRLLQRLGVFVGGCTLEAVCVVCADSVDDIEEGVWELVDHALLEVAHDPADATAEPRFQMLETVREYALAQLAARGEAELVRTKHAAYLVRWAEQLLTTVKTNGRTDAIACLGRERDNLRAALDWLTDQSDLQLALHLAAADAWLWQADGQVGEGRERLDRLLAAAPEPTPARAAALLSAADLAWSHGEYQHQERLARESLAIARAEALPNETAEGLSTLGAAAFQRGDYDAARELLAQSLGLFRTLGRQLGVSWTLMRLGSVARDQGLFAEAEHLYAEALMLRRAAGDQSGVAHILSNLSWLALYMGEFSRARALQEESLVIRRGIGDRREIAMSLVVLARIALAEGTRAAAWVPLREGLDVCRSVGDRWAIALALEALAGLLATGQPARAMRLAGAAGALRAVIGRPVPAPELPIVESWLEPARRALGHAAVAESAEGAKLTAEAAVVEAQAEAYAEWSRELGRVSAIRH